MTEYNDWFDEVSGEEYNQYIKGIRHIKPNHTKLTIKHDGAEFRLDGKMIAFWICGEWGKITYCITNEDIVC